MKDIHNLARRISLVQPSLDHAKYLEYAAGIFHAAKRYGIDPDILIAITQQETGFREDLPEGKAGERGICQVLKGWLKNSQFKQEFNKATVKDFHRPSKSFHFAAWILRDLKKRNSKGSLPYWSFYNANKFENRFRYYLLVNRFMSVLKSVGKKDSILLAEQERMSPPSRELGTQKIVPDATPPAPKVILPETQAKNGRRWRPDFTFVQAEEKAKRDPMHIAAAEPVAAPKPVKAVAEGSQGSWLAQAFRQLQSERNSRAEGRNNNPAIIRAAAELDVEGISSNFVEN